ncbi:MAG TPA: hypothetical protein VI933_04380 [archaeon]|nr:hypothetical protein [archaeon]
MAFVYFDVERDLVVVAKNRGLYGIDLGELPYRMRAVETEEYSFKDFRLLLVREQISCLRFLRLVHSPPKLSNI